MIYNYDMEVRGVIIECDKPIKYRFVDRQKTAEFGFTWTVCEDQWFYGDNQVERDEKARAWVEQNYPEAYKRGIEMRVYDKDTE
jgi:hypothetical protein